MQKKVVVCIPTHDRWLAGFGFDFAHMIGFFVGNPACIPPPQLAIHYCMTSLLHDGRQQLVNAAKQSGGTHILWLDNDMRFPKETLHILLHHEKEIVGVNYMTRRPPFRFTAKGMDGDECVTNKSKTGLEEVSHIGFGCLLTDIRVFEGDGPHFSFGWEAVEGGKGFRPVGEDVHFCRLAQAKKFKVYVDHDLSNQIGHIGEFTYTPEIAEQLAS